MRRHKRDREKPIPMSDLQQLAKFRAELEICNKLMNEGASHIEAMRKVFGDEGEVIPVRQNNARKVTMFDPED